jgi:hypothetical protein
MTNLISDLIYAALGLVILAGGVYRVVKFWRV